MTLRTIILALFLCSLPGGSVFAQAPQRDSLKYKVRHGDQLGKLMKALNLRPIWGEKGYVQKTAALNPEVIHNNGNLIFPNTWIFLPTTDLIADAHYQISPDQVVSFVKKPEVLPTPAVAAKEPFENLDPPPEKETASVPQEPAEKVGPAIAAKELPKNVELLPQTEPSPLMPPSPDRGPASSMEFDGAAVRERADESQRLPAAKLRVEPIPSDHMAISAADFSDFQEPTNEFGDDEGLKNRAPTTMSEKPHSIQLHVEPIPSDHMPISAADFSDFQEPTQDIVASGPRE